LSISSTYKAQKSKYNIKKVKLLPSCKHSIGMSFPTTTFDPKIFGARGSLKKIAKIDHMPFLKPKGEWQPDDDALSCGACSLLFTVIERRHHCRGY
jgi:hypothetical protein